MSIPPTGKKEKSIFLINYVLFIGIFYDVKSFCKDGGGPKPAAGFSDSILFDLFAQVGSPR